MTETPKPLPEVGANSARKSAIIGAKNKELQRQIREFLLDQHCVSLPPMAKTYREEIREIFDFDRFPGAVNPQTGEIGESGQFDRDAYTELNELCKFYYKLGENRIFLAQFTDGNGFDQVVKPLGQYYSKHRLDPIWNSSKSRKFRYRMARFLETERWFEQYHPTHLVLTVPHKHGKWRGKEIYIHELIRAFWELRRQQWWKAAIAAGLYCLEVKKNKQNGFHIHLHVLCFQEPTVFDDIGLKCTNPVNFVRGKIRDAWKKIVENTSDYDGIHYSSLYFYERDEEGKKIPVENCYYMASDEDPEIRVDQFGNEIDPMEIDMKQYKKRFIRRGDEVELWIKGVMECLKYHFKPGVLEKDDGSYNMELIMQLLENTKGDRFMSKFGKLYKHPGLTLNGKDQSETEENADIDAECLGSAAAAELALVNPFTGLRATEGDYEIIITRPECIYMTHDARGRPTVRLRPRSPVSIWPPGTTVLEAFRMYASKKFDGKRPVHMTTDQLATKGHPWRSRPERNQRQKSSNDEPPF